MKLSEAGDGRARLLRLLGVGSGVAVTVGGTVGVGTLRTPALVATQLPDAWLIRSATWEKAHDDAFMKAAAEVKPEFVQCPRCTRWDASGTQ